MAVHDRAVSDRDVLCGPGAATAVGVLAALHAEAVVPLVKAAILNQRALHRIEVDTVGVRAIAPQIKIANRHVIRAKQMNRPVRGISYTESFKTDISAIFELEETRTRNLLAESLAVPIVDLRLESTRTRHRHIGRSDSHDQRSRVRIQ